MKTKGRNLVILTSVLTAAVFSACFLDAVRNNPNDPLADNYRGNSIVETPKEWKDAERIDAQNDYMAFYPSVAIDSAGNSWAIWRQWNVSAAMPGVLARKYTNDDTGWGTDNTAVVLISDDFYGGQMWSLNVAMNPAGEAVAAFYHDDGASAYVYGNHTESGNWVAAEQMAGSTDMGSADGQMKLAVGTDKAIAFYREMYGAETRFGYDIFDCNTNTWGGDTQISESNSDKIVPRIAMNPDNKAIAMYSDQMVYQIYVGLFDGTSWTTFTGIETDAVDMIYMGDVAINKAGEAIAAWSVTEMASTIFKVKIKMYDGTAWGDAAVLYDEKEAWNIRAAMDPKGQHACVVWNTWDDGATFSELHAAVYGYGSNTWVEQRIDELSVSASNQKVAIDGFGNIFVIWLQGSPDTGRHLYGSRYTEDGGWSVPQKFDSLEMSISEMGDSGPEIAVSETGYATVVWCQDAGMAMPQTWAARYEDIAVK